MPERLRRWWTNPVFIGFGLAIAALLVNAFVSFWNIQRLHDNEAKVAHAHAVLTEVELVLSAVKDAETGQRGFLLTGDPAYLTPYNTAISVVDQRLARLDELTRGDHGLRPRLEEMRPLLRAKFAELAETITLRQNQGRESAREVVLSGRGLATMDAIRKLAGEMERDLLRLLRLRSTESQDSFITSQVAGILAVFLTVGMVVTAYHFVRRELGARLNAEHALRRAHDELEDRVRERTAELGATNEALSRSNRELEQFASVASHDLQEPLRKIQAFGDRLSARYGDVLEGQGRDYIERMQSSALRMRTLINDLLTFSRVTTKARPFQQVNLAAIARDVVSDLETRIQQSGGRVELGQLPVIDADPLQVQQLLQNLVGNALKFARPGEPPVVRVESRIFEPPAADSELFPGPRCEIIVQDNGIGFEEVYLDRIFEVFQRLHGRDSFEGTGMGLAICRKIAERHGGSITARSTPGQGSTFLVTLPMEHAKVDDSRDPS
jgi:signal transduction histidine kinase